MSDDTPMTAGESVDVAALRRWLREQEDEIRKLTGELHRVKLDRLDGAKRIDELLAEIERLRELSGDLMAERNECREERERLRKELRDCNNWIRSELGLEEAEEIAQRLG